MSSSAMVATSSPVIRTWPLVGRSRVPISCSKVVLPDPDQLPLADGEIHPAQGLDGRFAGIVLGHVVHIEHRHPCTAESDAVVGGAPVVVGCGWQRVGHVVGTTTCWPTASPEPLTCTSWWIPPAPTTSTA